MSTASEKPRLLHGFQRVKWFGCYFRFLSGRKWIFRQGCTASQLLSIIGLPVVITTSRSVEEPANGAISTSGRATSGSGLGATPIFQCEFPQLLWPLNDQYANAIATPCQRAWTAILLSVGLVPYPVGGNGARARHISRPTGGSWKTRGIHTRRAIYWKSHFYGTAESTHFYVCFRSLLSPPTDLH